MNALLSGLLMFQVLTQSVTVTAYTASYEECGKADGITASGRQAVEGVTIAADHLPFGTMVEIDGHLYMVQDRFGAGYDDKIDIFMTDKTAAEKFGQQAKDIKVYKFRGGKYFEIIKTHS